MLPSTPGRRVSLANEALTQIGSKAALGCGSSYKQLQYYYDDGVLVEFVPLPSTGGSGDNVK